LTHTKQLSEVSKD